MNNDTVICTIRWTVGDVRSAFKQEHGREPTKEELKNCVDNVDTNGLVNYSIENGWSFIFDAID